MDIPNVSSWRLNKAENQELQDRVIAGETVLDVKREIQKRKAVACEERKKAAAAIASKPGPSAGKKKKEPIATAPNPRAASNFQTESDPTNAAYYAAVESDLQTI